MLDTLSAHVALLRLILLVEAAAKPVLSEEPWQDYSVFDYPSVQDYCRVCLLNENASTNPNPSASLCYLPVIAPDGEGVNINALMAAQKTLLASDDMNFPLTESEHQQAAQKLVKVMRTHEMQPDWRLIEMAEIEEEKALFV